jgi:hypothetical protein
MTGLLSVFRKRRREPLRATKAVRIKPQEGTAREFLTEAHPIKPPLDAAKAPPVKIRTYRMAGLGLYSVSWVLATEVQEHPFGPINERASPWEVNLAHDRPTLTGQAPLNCGLNVLENRGLLTLPFIIIY